MASNPIKWSSVTVDNEPHDLRLSFTMRNFLDYVCKPDDDLESPRMECSRGCGAKWTLRVYPYGYSDDKKDDICVFLKLSDKPAQAEIAKATVEIYLLGEGDKKLKTAGPWEFEEAKLKSGYGSSKLVTRSELATNKDLYLPNGNLTIRCEGKVFFKKPTLIRGPVLEVVKSPEVVASNRAPSNRASTQSSNVLKKMYQEGIYCDFVLKADSGEFKCHKAILATTSVYFKALFEHDTKENVENVVDLSKDLDEEELRAMMDYIYLENPDLSNLSLASVQNVFRVSNTYAIDGLKEACEEALIERLDKDNVNALVVFGIDHGAERLKKAAGAIIAN